MASKKITIDWAVTGYQKFLIKPENNESLVLEREPNNSFDPYAILVKLKDGRIIGRVPANLSRLLTKIQRERVVTNLTCVYKGVCRRYYIIL